jgi:hypothetical protein
MQRETDGSAGDANYGTIGRTYSDYRQPEPTIAAIIDRALGAARTVLNVGAGAGSYEPRDRQVTPVEPSSSMRAQRPQNLVHYGDSLLNTHLLPSKAQPCKASGSGTKEEHKLDISPFSWSTDCGNEGLNDRKSGWLPVVFLLPPTPVPSGLSAAPVSCSIGLRVRRRVGIEEGTEGFSWLRCRRKRGHRLGSGLDEKRQDR